MNRADRLSLAATIGGDIATTLQQDFENGTFHAKDFSFACIQQHVKAHSQLPTDMDYLYFHMDCYFKCLEALRAMQGVASHA